jgi:hypothetical protein
VYKQNVEIMKLEEMEIGDGMDATVISGDRNYIDGWTTFRTAIFGGGRTSGFTCCGFMAYKRIRRLQFELSVKRL